VAAANAGGAAGTDTYIDLVSSWVHGIAAAFKGK